MRLPKDLNGLIHCATLSRCSWLTEYRNRMRVRPESTEVQQPQVALGGSLSGGVAGAFWTTREALPIQQIRRHSTCVDAFCVQLAVNGCEGADRSLLNDISAVRLAARAHQLEGGRERGKLFHADVSSAQFERVGLESQRIRVIVGGHFTTAADKSTRVL